MTKLKTNLQDRKDKAEQKLRYCQHQEKMLEHRIPIHWQPGVLHSFSVPRAAFGGCSPKHTSGCSDKVPLRRADDLRKRFALFIQRKLRFPCAG